MSHRDRLESALICGTEHHHFSSMDFSFDCRRLLYHFKHNLLISGCSAVVTELVNHEDDNISYPVRITWQNCKLLMCTKVQAKLSKKHFCL